MDIFSSLAIAADNDKDSAWGQTENYVKEERPVQSVRKIIVKGSVDVVFRRYDKPTLIVAGETAEAVSSVKTYYKGDKLVIEREGVSISFGNGRMVFHGSVDFVAGGNIVNGKPVDGSFNGSLNPGRVVVGIAMPVAPAIKIKGSGDVTLLDLRQSGLDLEIEGSGDITAYGQVSHLDVQIAGSGDVDASELVADCACLSVAGSGDIEAFVRSDVHARVAGSGDIVVRGNPSRRDHSVAGSGKIKFR